MSYTHLTEQERYVISHLNVAGYSKREIARRINRHHTSVTRELKRNGPPQFDCCAYWYNCGRWGDAGKKVTKPCLIKGGRI